MVCAGLEGSLVAAEGAGGDVHPSLLGQDQQKRWKFVLDAPSHVAKQIHAELSERGVRGSAPFSLDRALELAMQCSPSAVGCVTKGFTQDGIVLVISVML